MTFDGQQKARPPPALSVRARPVPARVCRAPVASLSLGQVGRVVPAVPRTGPYAPTWRDPEPGPAASPHGLLHEAVRVHS